MKLSKPTTLVIAFAASLLAAGAARSAASRTFAVYEHYLAAAAIYLAFSYLLVLIVKFTEDRFLAIPGK